MDLSQHEPLLNSNEREPLHTGPSGTFPPHHFLTAIDRSYGSVVSRGSNSPHFVYKTAPVVALYEAHDSDEPTCLSWSIMEKVKRSKVAQWADKFAVENDQNLTTAQLML